MYNRRCENDCGCISSPHHERVSRRSFIAVLQSKADKEGLGDQSFNELAARIYGCGGERHKYKTYRNMATAATDNEPVREKVGHACWDGGAEPAADSLIHSSSSSSESERNSNIRSEDGMLHSANMPRRMFIFAVVLLSVHTYMPGASSRLHVSRLDARHDTPEKVSPPVTTVQFHKVLEKLFTILFLPVVITLV